MKPIHFSTLKLFSKSPLHYHYALTEHREATRAMKVGTIAHNLVLGPHSARPLLCFPGQKRVGKAWEQFDADRPPHAEVVTQPEWDDAVPIANAVNNDPIAARLLAGARREVPLSWKSGGFDCATDGIDFVNGDVIGDLKITNDSSPMRFQPLATRMHYHAQGAWMQEAARANGIPAKQVKIIAVESTAPYPVTVYNLSEDVLREGRKLLVLWMERLRSCIDNNTWPAYSQTEVEFTLPAWSYDAEEESETDE